MNAFISYSMVDKLAGKTVKEIFDGLSIDSFLAHDDLVVSEPWRDRILDEVGRCEIFVPLLSKDFRESDWCSQEVGAAVQRGGVLIIPLSLDGTRPYGFLSAIQTHGVEPENLHTEGRDVIWEALGRRWPSIAIDKHLKNLDKAYTFRSAEALVKPLVPFFDQFSKPQAREFAKKSIENSQIWSAVLCRTDYLPKFLKSNKRRIPAETFQALKYQIDEQSWYANRND